MRKLTILVDMDDTIEQLLAGWVAYLNKRYGTQARPEDSRAWDVSQLFPTLTHDEVYSVLLEDALWHTVQPIPGAAEALQQLRRDGHRVLVVTASAYQTLPAKMDGLLFRYFPFFTWEDVIVTHHKQLIRGDVLVDDGPHNLEFGAYARILMSAPYNRGYDAPGHGMVRVENWQEAYEAICRIAGVPAPHAFSGR